MSTVMTRPEIDAAKAEAFAAYTLARIRTLVGDYIEYSDGFEGVTTYVYTGA